MKNLARKYKPSTVRRLDTLSGNQCAKPNCTKSLIANDQISIISKICHIEAASEGGARYNSLMTDDDRRHFDNLILLCDECHIIIDNKQNESLYPVSLLKEWKKTHESNQQYKLSLSPSFLKLAIDAISQAEFENCGDVEDKNYRSFDINEKINYNEIKTYKSLIDDYSVFYGKVNSIYDELEKHGSFKKEKLLRNIKNIYLKTKGKYVGSYPYPIQQICSNADGIIEEIENTLFDLINKKQDQHKEDISFEISIIMVDAFMRCKILEEPKPK